MSDEIDRQQAFPSVDRLALLGSDQFGEEVKETIYMQSTGMTLRDYFAASAMQGMISENMFRHEPNAGTAIAGAAYDMADCMMEVRK